MGIEEKKLRATFWNNLSVGFFLTGCAIPAIWIYQVNERVANAPPISWEAFHFSVAIASALLLGFGCRARALAMIKSVDRE